MSEASAAQHYFDPPDPPNPECWECEHNFEDHHIVDGEGGYCEKGECQCAEFDDWPGEPEVE